jgi:hypothetical protein
MVSIAAEVSKEEPISPDRCGILTSPAGINSQNHQERGLCKAGKTSIFGLNSRNIP